VQIQLTQFVNTAMAKVQAEADRRVDAMAKAQAEADRRADAMFQKLAQMLEMALRNDKDRATPFVRADVM
jgi:membrane protein involved in colicin uptake